MSNDPSPSDWPYLVKAGMFELRTPLHAVGGYARLLQLEQLGPLTDKQRTALQAVTQYVSAIWARVHQMEQLSELDRPVGKSQSKEDVALGQLLLEVAAGAPPVEAGTPVDVRTTLGQDNVVAHAGALRQALTGVVRSVMWDQLRSQEPLSIWVVDPVGTDERWIVIAAQDRIQEAAAVPSAKLSPLNEPSRLTLDVAFARRVIAAHKGRLLSLPEGLSGAVIALPRP